MFQNYQDGNTALHLAASNNRDVIATILLNRDCDLYIQNRDVSTSTRVCIFYSNPWIAVIDITEVKHSLLF